MAATPLSQAGMAAGNPSLDGAAAIPPPPGTDMTGMCFRDQLWLNTYPLDRNLVFDYFVLSPFYDWTCNNEQLRSRSIHPLDSSHLSKMTGIEYMLSEVMEPHLFVIRKVKRDSPEKTTAMLTYYILDGSIYQAPQLCNVFASRIWGTHVEKQLENQFYTIAECFVAWKEGRSVYHISKAFNIAASKLEKIGYVAADSEIEGSSSETKAPKETIDIKELKRVDHILATLQRKHLRKLPDLGGCSGGFSGRTHRELERLCKDLGKFLDEKWKLRTSPCKLLLPPTLQLPPAPPPPPFPEGYAPPVLEAAKGLEDQQSSEALPLSVDPIIDQGPAKRMKLQ
ncbi:Mediator of RNA polymerase II transcription subunit 6 [Apostasia shenzhenica]|uniref:Mediator of RNA polymerase II transcription subunit 6 n=1 Tax=Apostasia shenzhenica TaxID=1088818 RepID=A0A2I0B5J5_9ASPA|nr:Mediator of RNA polymerase II transcription subunit 6 [Apostasia shenzhenica]